MISALLREGLHAWTYRAGRRISPCLKEGRGRHGRSAEDGSGAERGACENHPSAGLKLGDLFACGRLERHLTCSAAASDADHNLSMGGFRVDSSIRHLACGFAPAHSLGAVDLLAERDPPCRDRRDLRSNAFFVQPEDYYPTFTFLRPERGKAQCGSFLILHVSRLRSVRVYSAIRDPLRAPVSL